MTAMQADSCTQDNEIAQILSANMTFCTHRNAVMFPLINICQKQLIIVKIHHSYMFHLRSSRHNYI